MKSMKIRITFTEEILGTSPANKEIYESFIGKNAPDAKSLEEEIEAVGTDEVIEKAMTVFARNNEGKPCLWDYQIKGFFKDSCSMLNRVSGKDEKGKKLPSNESSKLTAFKKIVDGMIFVKPRMILLIFDGELGTCQRPLRGQTAQGERIALANSETAPAGTRIDIEIIMLSDAHEAAIREWLDYGALRGIGQWRNGGKGSFTWEEV